MNGAHFHLVVNHIPVVGIFLGLILLLWGHFKKSADIKKFTIIFFIGLGIATAVAYLSGERAEEVVEHMVGFSHDSIEEHEDASVFGLIGIEIMAVLSLAALVFKKQTLLAKPWFFKLLIFLALWNCTIMARVAFLGGQIRHHTEISK